MSVDIEAIPLAFRQRHSLCYQQKLWHVYSGRGQYKNGVSDIMNMRLKHAISMTAYAQELKKQ